MNTTYQIIILPGEGIGPEVTGEARRVLEWFALRQGIAVDIREESYGVATYRQYGTPVREEVFADLCRADAVLFGATGGPEFEQIPWDIRRRYGLLSIRRAMDVFANLRPITGYAELADATPFRSGHVDHVDAIIVRELTSGVYFGQPRGIETDENGDQRGFDTQIYSTGEIERVVRFAFELAQTRSGRLTSVDKSNVMESGRLWRQVVSRLAGDYQQVALSHMLADNCGLQLVRAPAAFDVLVTDNLFGDLLSDVGAAVSGSLGMLPSASLGAKDTHGHRNALYEPVHGSAPDIAGKGIANPLGAILSVALALEFSFNASEQAQLLRQAVRQVLAAGIRTPDIRGQAADTVSTRQMGDAVLNILDTLS
jgi:3-isopropylmalate dehydrogenase